MSKRPKRRVIIKSKTPITPPRKWRDYEMEIALNCIKKFGHKDLDKICEQLPGRSIENIKTFFRTIYTTARKIQGQNDDLSLWIEKSDKRDGQPWKDCIQVAHVLKYLSVDGLLENHPLPERCQGIDFRQAYRLIYQALMGYPIQPVNKPTADFVLKTFAELNGEVKSQTQAIKKVESFFNSKSTTNEGNSSSVQTETPNNNLSHTGVNKPLKVYQRKKLVSSNAETKPSLKITVEEIPSESSSGCLKNFSVAVEGSRVEGPTTVNVPVPYQPQMDEQEQELLKSNSYNPFQIPEQWLKEPFYINLLQTL